MHWIQASEYKTLFNVCQTAEVEPDEWPITISYEFHNYIMENWLFRVLL